jgi:transposase
VDVRPIRKRRWSAAEKLTILREGLEPGVIATQVMRRYGISSSLFYTWRKQALAAAPAGFVPVRIEDPARLAPPVPGRCGQIEITLPDGTHVRIEGDTEARTIAAAVKAARG